MSELLTVFEAAERLRISPKTLRTQFIETGKIEVVELGKRLRKIESSEIDRLIQRSKIKLCQSTKEVKRGGSSLRSTAKRLDDLLGQNQSGKPKSTKGS